MDQDQDVGAGVAAADAEVVQAAVVAQGELAAAVDAVMSDAVVAVVEGAAGRDWARNSASRNAPTST
ncbi:MAG: hypothetical protein ACR2J5_17050 [Geodermatophilaceae bacterium]